MLCAMQILFRGILRCAVLRFFVPQAASPPAAVGESLMSSGVDDFHDFLSSCEFIVVPIWCFEHAYF